MRQKGQEIECNIAYYYCSCEQSVVYLEVTSWMEGVRWRDEVKVCSNRDEYAKRLGYADCHERPQ